MKVWSFMGPPKSFYSLQVTTLVVVPVVGMTLVRCSAVANLLHPPTGSHQLFWRPINFWTLGTLSASLLRFPVLEGLEGVNPATIRFLSKLVVTARKLWLLPLSLTRSNSCLIK